MNNRDVQGIVETPGFQEVVQLLDRARRVVVLTGAGVSAESGIATFRDAKTGHWSRFNPEELASPEGFARDPGLVWRWYMERFGQLLEAEPNRAHHALAELAPLLPHFTLVTQNVDDLHERAGSQRVLHLHGSLNEFRCSGCAEPYALTLADRSAARPPACPACGALIRPGVVWFGELLPEELLHEAWEAARRCDLFVVIGTSGIVMPAAALPDVAQRAGAAVVDINPESNEVARRADVALRARSGLVLPALAEALQARRKGQPAAPPA